LPILSRISLALCHPSRVAGRGPGGKGNGGVRGERWEGTRGRPSTPGYMGL